MGSNITGAMGYCRQECGHGTPADPCGAPATWHVAVTEDDAAVTTIDGTPDGTLLDWDRCEHIFACDEHAHLVQELFRWRVPHLVVPPCGHPDSEFRDHGCVFPGSGGIEVGTRAEVHV